LLVNYLIMVREIALANIQSQNPNLDKGILGVQKGKLDKIV